VVSRLASYQARRYTQFLQELMQLFAGPPLSLVQLFEDQDVVERHSQIWQAHGATSISVGDEHCAMSPKSTDRPHHLLSGPVTSTGGESNGSTLARGFLARRPASERAVELIEQRHAKIASVLECQPRGELRG
jgi:hypothetical protein